MRICLTRAPPACSGRRAGCEVRRAQRWKATLWRRHSQCHRFLLSPSLAFFFSAHRPTSPPLPPIAPFPLRLRLKSSAPLSRLLSLCSSFWITPRRIQIQGGRAARHEKSMSHILQFLLFFFCLCFFSFLSFLFFSFVFLSSYLLWLRSLFHSEHLPAGEMLPKLILFLGCLAALFRSTQAQYTWSGQLNNCTSL